MRDESLTNVAAVTSHHVDHPRREVGLLNKLGQFQGRERRAFVGFDDHRIAGNQRRSDLARGKRQWIVPGCQSNDHAVSDTLYPNLFVRLVRGQDIAGYAARLLGSMREVKSCVLNFAASICQRLALLGNDNAGETLAILNDQTSEPPK